MLNSILIFLYIFILILTLFNLSFQTNDYIITNLSYYNNNSILIADIDYNESKIFNISDYDISPINNTDKISLIKKLQLIVILECDSIFHYQIIDREKKRFIANFTDEEYKNNLKYCKNFLNLNEFGFKIGNINETFTFSITINNETIYILNNYQFLYSDTLIVFTQELSSKYIFGFGERRFDFNLIEGKYTIWPNDTGHTYRDELNGGWNLMGHQPIGLHKTKNNLYMGMIFMNSNAQDVIIQKINNDKNDNNDNKENNDKYNLEHRTIGGIINYYLVFGNSPERAILNIHKIIGRPTIPPYWGLGWHQCRWGYNNTDNVKYVNDNYSYYKIPLDGLWTDVDMMENAYNFHLNRKYSDMPKFIKTLHEQDGRKFIALVDYAIPNNNSEKYYKLGLEKNAFILSNYTNEPLISYVWPGNSVFPDFFVPEGIELWKTGLNDYFELLDYDGMWIDMNEPGAITIFSLGKGEIVSDNLYKDIEKDLYRFLPYLPGYKNQTYGNLQTKAVSLNAYSHLNDPKNNFYTMHNVRIFISKYQIKATNEYLKSLFPTKKKFRPFIVSRANTIGHGKYGFHWLGDNNSTMSDLHDSITGIFNYNIYGIPFTGADICGFHDDAIDTICARWHNLAVIYPFTRNHNELTCRSQEPWMFNKIEYGDKENTLKSAKYAINLRYSLIRYIYTQLMLVSLGESGCYFKPVYFEFLWDNKLLDDKDILNGYVMAGKALYYIPNFSEDSEDYEGYFPNCNFNEFPSGKRVIDYKKNNNNSIIEDNIIKLNGGFQTINIFLKGGSIITYQDTFSEYIKSTEYLRQKPFDLIINPNENNLAYGDIIYDNDQIDVIENKDYTFINVFYHLNNIEFIIKNKAKSEYIYLDNIINNIIIYRAKDVINEAKQIFNSAKIVFNGNQIKNININFDENEDKLKINGINVPIENINYIYLKKIA